MVRMSFLVVVGLCAGFIVGLTSLGQPGWQGFAHASRQYGSTTTPISVAVGSRGYVYLVDPPRNAVQVRSSAGKVVSRWYGFHWPRAVAIGPHGRVYVADDSGINEYSSTGKWLFAWKQSYAKYIRSFAVDGWGDIFAIDARQQYLMVLNPAGKYVGTWKGFSTANCRVTQASVALDTHGHLFIGTDCGYIYKLTSHLAFQHHWYASGGIWGVVHDDSGHIYAVNQTAGYIEKYADSGQLLCRVQSEPGAAPNSVTWNADNRLFIGYSASGAVRVRDVGPSIRTSALNSIGGMGWHLDC